MMISTKGRYALRFLSDLASVSDGSFIPLKETAERQGISIKYLEKIALTLTQNGILESGHGKGGGYRLKTDPKECTVFQILEVMEEGIAPVACLGCGAKPCTRADLCPTLPMWRDFYRLTKEYFSSITLHELSTGSGIL